jgi:lambda family phage minor tail protein L
MTQIPPNAETLKTQSTQIIDLFTLDITVLLPIDSEDQAVYKFCNWTQVGGNDVTYQGSTYTAIPMQADGFARTGSGQLERPTLTF